MHQSGHGDHRSSYLNSSRELRIPMSPQRAKEEKQEGYNISIIGSSVQGGPFILWLPGLRSLFCLGSPGLTLKGSMLRPQALNSPAVPSSQLCRFGKSCVKRKARTIMAQTLKHRKLTKDCLAPSSSSHSQSREQHSAGSGRGFSLHPLLSRGL